MARTLAIALAALAALTAAGLPAHARADDVHKCVVRGAVTYQAGRCAGADDVLALPPGPSALEQQQARIDAEVTRRRAARDAAEPAGPQPTAVHTVDPRTCAQLERAYADAWGRRNGLVHGGHLGMAWNDAAVEHEQATIARIQATARETGCTLAP